MTQGKLLTKPKSICFDVGNVLIFPNGAIIAKILASLFKRSFSPKTCRDALLVADKEKIFSKANFVEAWGNHIGLQKEEAEIGWNACQKANKTNKLRWWNDVHSQAATVLTALKKQDLLLAVISNADGRVERDLFHYGLGQFFSVIIDSHFVGHTKPDRQIYEICLDRLNINSGQCWFIGDTIPELIGAKNAGFGEVIHYDSLDLYTDDQNFIRINRLEDLLQLIQGDASV